MKFLSKCQGNLISLPDASGDNPVSVPHPDALPDVLLDLVVVLANRTVGGKSLD